MEVSEREVGVIYGRVGKMWKLYKGWLGEEEVLRKEEERGKTAVAKNGVESKQQRWNCSPKQLLLLLLDFVFTQTVLNMLSTSAWRGVWNLWDLYLYGGLYLEEPWGPLEITGVFQVIIPSVLERPARRSLDMGDRDWRHKNHCGN